MKTTSAVLTIGQRGVVTIPKDIRDAYQLEVGDSLTLLDLGGSMLLTPGRSDIDELANQIGRKLKKENHTLAELLNVAREERAKYEKKSPRTR